jgi:hypothetical protein
MTVKKCTLRPLTKNFEGLRRHNQLQIFVPSQLSTEERRVRTWLVHVVHKAARHYGAARDIVLADINSSRLPDGSVVFHMWDFCLEMEDCVATSYKALKCAAMLANRGAALGALEMTPEGRAVARLRNKLEHMHTEIGGGQSGSGPVYISLDASRENLCLRDVNVPVDYVPRLLENLFDVVAAMFPEFDPESEPQGGGPTRLSIEATIEVIPVPAPGAVREDSSAVTLSQRAACD